MSLNYYGQPSYAATAYPQPPMQGGFHYQYQQSAPPPPPPAPPAPVYYMDPGTFRRDYSSRLAELTVNSRPIIQNLSMLAHEYTRFADIVSQCLEAHIRRVPPWMKLPAFYLLDMISKNIYDPYARHFATFVTPLFLETYHQVDENTRGKLEELIQTWRTGSPAGKELFGVSAQVSIERGVWGDGASAHNLSNNFHSGSGQITKAQVLSELEYTLGQKERALQSNPYDTLSQTHINVLHQLRKLVEAGVSQEELRQILSQLRSLVQSTAPPPPPPPQAPPMAAQWPPQLAHLSPPPPALQAPQLYPQSTPFSHPSFSAIKSEHVPSMPPTSAPIPSIAGPSSMGISDILSTLMKAGIAPSKSGTPVGTGPTAKEEDVKPGSPDLTMETTRAYRQSILSNKIRLTLSDITKKQPPIVDFLYNKLAAQCKQCGIRFVDSVVGKKAMEEHLDMHFRQNRKANQNIGRGHSRSWFVGLEDWVSDTSDVKGKGRADGSRPMNAKAAAAADVAHRDAELRGQYVVVPAGDEAKPIACPICKETIKSEFLEDDEDWVWKNATMKDERVYHATCHAEALASSSNLVARLRNELTGQVRSRSGTPEAQAAAMRVVTNLTPPPSASKRGTKSLSPSPDAKRAALKRKVDDGDGSSEDVEGTPPFKKVALSTAVAS